MAGEPPFPVEPVEPAARPDSDSKKNKECTVEYGTLAPPKSSLSKSPLGSSTGNNSLEFKQFKQFKRYYQINLHVSEEVYEAYHSLDREKKRLVRRVVEEVIRKMQSVDINTVIANVTLNLDLNVNAQIVRVERVSVGRELFKKYENAIRCIKVVLGGGFANKLGMIQKCVEGL